MKVLSKAEMLARANPVPVLVPEHGDECGLFVRKLTGRQRLDLLAQIREEEDNLAVVFKAIAFCACDENGVRIFENADEAEKVILDPATIEALGQECLRANGLLKSSLEEAQKKSETIQSTDSGSN